MGQADPMVVVTYTSLVATLVATACTFVLAVLTAKYVRLTSRLVEESREQREPVVTLDFEVPDHSIVFVVENHGVSPARNVRIQVLQDTEWVRSSEGTVGLTSMHPVRHGISLLTPGRKLKYRAGHANWTDVPEVPIPVTLELSYENLAGRGFHNTIHFDFQQLCNVLFDSFRDPQEKVARAIKDSDSHRQSSGQLDRWMQYMSTPQKKRCEMCCEDILAEAKVCKHCGATQEAAG